MESLSVPELVERLGRDEESVRKMAVFKLQSAIGDPSFADVFIQEGGLPKLRFLALHATGNTLAYCLTSLSRLLELDKGWDHVTDDLIKRVSPPRWWLAIQASDSVKTDCRTGRRATSRQRQPRRNVRTRRHRWPSVTPKLAARRHRLPTPEARRRIATPVLAFARRENDIGRSRSLRKLPATYKRIDARCHSE